MIIQKNVHQRQEEKNQTWLDLEDPLYLKSFGGIKNIKRKFMWACQTYN